MWGGEIPPSKAGYFSHCRKVTKRQFRGFAPENPFVLERNQIGVLLVPPSVSLGGMPCGLWVRRFKRDSRHIHSRCYGRKEEQKRK